MLCRQHVQASLEPADIAGVAPFELPQTTMSSSGMSLECHASRTCLGLAALARQNAGQLMHCRACTGEASELEHPCCCAAPAKVSHPVRHAAGHYGLKSMAGAAHYLHGCRSGRHIFLEELWERHKGTRPKSSVAFAKIEEQEGLRKQDPADSHESQSSCHIGITTH